MIIKRTINGESINIEISQNETEEIMRQNKIQFAKDILENYKYAIVGYKKYIKDENILVEFHDLLEQKMMNNNGDLELEAIGEIFQTKDID